MERGIGNKDNKIWVTVSHTIPLANYENAKIEIGMETTLSPREIPADSIDSLFDQLSDILYEKSRKIKRQYLPKKEKSRNIEYD